MTESIQDNDTLSHSGAKRVAVADDLKRRIVRGEWRPGERIPSQRALASHYQVSTRTQHYVLEQVTADGFLAANGANGTYVSATPPHLSRFGLVFPAVSTDHESLQWQALRRAANTLSESAGHRFPVYQGVDEVRGLAAREQLLADIRQQRLGGLILPSPPDALANCPIPQLADLPSIAFQAHHRMPGCGWVDTGPAHELAFKRALAHLRDTPRRRLGYIHLATSRPAYDPEQAGLVTTAQAFGLQVEPHWVHGAVPGNWQALRSIFDVLWRLPNESRPDCLYVADDNLVGDVVRACQAQHICIPDDLTITAHANFPCPPEADVPLYLVGLDLDRALALCVDWVLEQRRDTTTTDSVRAPITDSLRRST